LPEVIKIIVDDCIFDNGVYNYNYDFSEFPKAPYFVVLKIIRTVISQKLEIQK